MEKESGSENQHGLSRYIPLPVQREIRQRCGFGCARCGSAIYQYEHIDPPYSEAKSHDPKKITLLCGGCHDKVTRKFLSKNTVSKDNEDPICRRQGFASEWFDVGVDHPSITIGGTTLASCDEILTINNEIILGIEPPEELGSPYRISGKFYNEKGTLLFEIDRNEFKGTLEAWDIETKGRDNS
ncbi:MAG: HNH endonuclease [Planctomycetota bacterium]|nr:HNH endonuclease [Planctomycetota bacterium]